MPITQQQADQIVNTYVEGFAKEDVDMVVSLFAEDATMEDPVGGGLRNGLAEIREFYEFAIKVGSSLELKGPVRAATLGNELAFPFTVTTPMGVIDVIDTFEINEQGRIVKMRAFWDASKMQASQ